MSVTALPPDVQDTQASRSTLIAPTSTGDHDTFAHYVKIHALIEGGEATALCGKKWTPRKDPARYPVCPDCRRIYESLPEGPS